MRRTAINLLDNFAPYTRRQFVIDHRDPVAQVACIYAESKDTPCVFHISRQQYDEMVRAGWNSSILRKFKFKLGDFTYELPNIPPYEVWIQYCTCRKSKEPLFKVIDESNPDTSISFGFAEPCPITAFHAIVSRQCGTKVNPDVNHLTDYARFS